MVDVALIGAGPIGIEMAGVLSRAGIRYVHLESGPIGNTITRWPRNTQFFSSPEWIAIAGIPIQTAGQEIATGEQYLAYLRMVVESLSLEVQTYESVTGISGSVGNYSVETRTHSGEDRRYNARFVILATGDMNHARTIGVPGEQLPHVTHYWSDPHDYFQRELLIVGGRNSAVEAALRCWRAGARVSISYRGTHLDEARLISRLQLELDLLVRTGQITFYPLTTVDEIRPGVTVLRGVDDAREASPGNRGPGGANVPYGPEDAARAAARAIDDGQDAAAGSRQAIEAESSVAATDRAAGGPGPSPWDVASAAHAGKAVMTDPGSTREVNSDFVYLATGFEMDQSLYEAIGIETVDAEKKPVHDKRTMESNTPGVFVVGTSIGGNQRGYKVFITTSHVHCLRAGREISRRIISEDSSRDLAEIQDSWVGNLADRDYPLSSQDVE